MSCDILQNYFCVHLILEHTVVLKHLCQFYESFIVLEFSSFKCRDEVCGEDCFLALVDIRTNLFEFYAGNRIENIVGMRADAAVFKVIKQRFSENTCHTIVEAVGNAFLCNNNVRKRFIYLVQIGEIGIPLNKCRTVVVDSLDVVSDIVTSCF